MTKKKNSFKFISQNEDEKCIKNWYYLIMPQMNLYLDWVGLGIGYLKKKQFLKILEKIKLLLEAMTVM